MAAVEQMTMPFTLEAGGATVDTSKIGSLTFGKDTKDLAGQFKKSADVRLTVVCRVVGVKLVDKYDAHGNISETVREHSFRVDEVVECDLEAEDNFTTVAQAAEAEAQAAADAAADGGES